MGMGISEDIKTGISGGYEEAWQAGALTGRMGQLAPTSRGTCAPAQAGGQGYRQEHN